MLLLNIIIGIIGFSLISEIYKPEVTNQLITINNEVSHGYYLVGNKNISITGVIRFRISEVSSPPTVRGGVVIELQESSRISIGKKLNLKKNLVPLSLEFSNIEGESVKSNSCKSVQIKLPALSQDFREGIFHFKPLNVALNLKKVDPELLKQLCIWNDSRNTFHHHSTFTIRHINEILAK